jgi:hypothetical protein
MHFNIVIYDKFIDMFLDMVGQFQHYLTLNNHTFSIVNNISPNDNTANSNINIKYIFFGTSFKNKFIPENSILTMFDNISLFDNMIPENLLKNNDIYHYSKHDCKLLKDKYENIRLYYFKMGYNPYLDISNSFANLNYVYDIVFVGNLSSRRKKIIDSLQNKGYKVFTGGYQPYIGGLNRSKLYFQSKIVLALYTDSNTFYNTLGSRVIPAVSTKAFTITEKCLDDEINSELEKYSIISDYDNIVDICEYYLTNETERENLKNNFYSNLKSTSLEIIKI